MADEPEIAESESALTWVDGKDGEPGGLRIDLSKPMIHIHMPPHYVDSRTVDMNKVYK